MAELVLAAFLLGIGILVLMAFAHRLGRGVASLLVGRKVTRPRELVRFVSGVCAELIVFGALLVEAVNAYPEAETSGSVDTALFCAFFAALGTRPFVFVSFASSLPALAVEGRSLRYLVTGNWYRYTELRRSTGPWRMWRDRDDPDAFVDAVVETGHFVDYRLRMGSRVSRRDRSFRHVAAVTEAALTDDPEQILAASDAVAATRVDRWNEWDAAALVVRCSALHAVRSLDQCAFLADLLLTGRLPKAATRAVEPLQAELANLLAYCLALLGKDLERAEELARFALADGDSIAIRATLAAVLVQSHDPETGVEILAETLDESVDEPLKTQDEFDTRLFLALGLSRLGRTAEAEQQEALAAELGERHGLDRAPAFTSSPL